MNRRVPGAVLRKQHLSHFHWGLVFGFLVLPLLSLFLSGCQKKPASEAHTRAITHDLVAAAQSAAGQNAQVSIRPEMGRFGNGRPSLVADDIFIDLSDASRRSAVEQALDRAAARHHLTRLSDLGSPTNIHFDYLFNGRRTHSIHIVITSAGNAQSKSVEPRLGLIIDDIGSDKPGAEALLKLPCPLTLSILPAQSHSAEIADEAYRRGDQVMLHLPMEFQGNTAKAEPVELRVGMPASQVQRLLAQMLATVPHAVGVNNHEGSLATTQPQLMGELMEALRQRNLFFIDSRTTAATVAYTTAQRIGVPSASRRVFLDDVETRDAILRQLDLAAREAVDDGSAIAIGHPRPATIAALTEGVPHLKSRVRIVFVSTLVH